MSAGSNRSWRFQASQGLKASPIVADGVIYITAPDNLWAIDAHTGKELWHHQHTKNNAFHIGHSGAAIYKDTVYLTTPDCHLIALSTKTGKSNGTFLSPIRAKATGPRTLRWSSEIT